MAELVTEEQKAVKLPYFHRVLSDEEQRLIGDITPKVISATPSAIAATSTSVAETAAWNGAGTWEERDVTKSARIVLEEAFSSSFEVAKDGGYVALFEPAENVKGHASITHVRGTPRFMYEWSFDLQFQVTNNSGDGGPYAGKVTVDDVVNDQLDDIELAITWIGQPPAGAHFQAVKSLLTGKATAKKAIADKVRGYETEFRKARLS